MVTAHHLELITECQSRPLTQCRCRNLHASLTLGSYRPTTRPWSADLSHAAAGAAASAALQPDEPALEVPAAALITLRTAMDSDLGPLLQILPGLDADTALTLWTMYDRADAESPRGPFWRALPGAKSHLMLSGSPTTSARVATGARLVHRVSQGGKRSTALLFCVSVRSTGGPLCSLTEVFPGPQLRSPQG